MKAGDLVRVKSCTKDGTPNIFFGIVFEVVNLGDQSVLVHIPDLNADRNRVWRQSKFLEVV